MRKILSNSVLDIHLLTRHGFGLSCCLSLSGLLGKLKYCLYILVFIVPSVLFGQIPVTVTGHTNTTPNLATNYTSFGAALTALNGITAMTGPVTLTLDAGASETAPPKGFVHW